MGLVITGLLPASMPNWLKYVMAAFATLLFSAVAGFVAQTRTTRAEVTIIERRGDSVQTRDVKDLVKASAQEFAGSAPSANSVLQA